MRRSVLAGVGCLYWTVSASAQPPTRPIQLPDLSPPSGQIQPPAGSAGPAQPPAPRPLPPGLTRTPGNPGQTLPPPAQPADQLNLPPRSDVELPYPEKKAKLDRSSLTVRKATGGWQVWGGPVLVHAFGEDRAAAEETARAIRDLGPTEWATLGTTRPVIGYPAGEGPARLSVAPKQAAAVDLMSVRVENVRGVWVVRDANGILLNFGQDRRDAEQAVAVARRYGFNRIGYAGTSGAEPTYSFFFAAPEVASQSAAVTGPNRQLVQLHQEESLRRTGVPVPGIGFVGERILIDPRKVEVRRDGYTFALAHGSDVIAGFGGNEWSARDALRIVQDIRPTEFCRVSGQAFFLVNGKAPDKVPFTAQGTPFDPKNLLVRQTGDKFGVYEHNGRQLFPVASQADGDVLIQTIQGFGFDQVCQIGPSGAASLKFLAKSPGGGAGRPSTDGPAGRRNGR